MYKFILWFCGIVFLLFCIYSAPIDIFISQLPYNSLTHRFYGEEAWWCGIVYKLVPIIVGAIVLGSMVTYGLKNRLKLGNARAKKLALVTLLSLIIGPGLIANSLLKENWGRPRPYQVLRDNKPFRAFYQPDLGNSSNNSFPSGHATIGFFLGVPLLVLGRRRLGIFVAVCGGAVVGLVRILQGGHYFSDVIFSGIIIWGTSELIIWLYDKYIGVQKT